MLSDRQSSNSVYKFSKNLAQPLPQQRRRNTIKHKLTSKLPKDQPPQGFYFNIQVIRKVATFLQNIKTVAVRQKQQLLPLQAMYLQNQQTQNQSSENLIGWENSILLIYELFLLILIIGALWMNSYQFVFGSLKDVNIKFNATLLSFYLLHILIYLNTQLKNQKLQIVDSRKLILSSYIHNRLLYDLIIVTGIILQLSGSSIFFYPSRIMVTPIFHLFMTLLTKFENKFAVSIEVESIISILKLLFKIIIFIHLLSLIFNGMSIIEKQKGISITWIEKNNFSTSSQFELYVYGWYWGSTIISTVGFGDITPANVYECGFISFIELLCSVMLGYSVNYIGTMIGVFGQSKATYQKDIRRLNKYLKTLTIPSTLENSIRSHFFNKYQIQQVYDAQSQHYLFRKLTQKLRTQVKQTNNLNIIRQCKILNVFSQQTLQQLAGIMKKTVYAPSEILFDEKTQNVKLFIIEQGKVNELSLINKFNKKQKPILQYSNDEENTIGWLNFINDKSYSSCAQAETYTITYQMSREQFINVLKKNAKDFLKFNQLREKNIQKPTKFIKKCLVCGRLTHNVVYCPKIHFIPRKLESLLIHQRKQALFNINKRNRNFIRNQSKFKRIKQESNNQVDQIYEIQTNRQSNKVQQTNRSRQIQPSAIRAAVNRKQTLISMINDSQTGQNYTTNAQNQENKNIQMQVWRSKKYTQSIKKIPQDFIKRTLHQIGQAFINNNEGLDEQNKLKMYILGRFDKIMTQQNKEFFSEFNFHNIVKFIKLDLIHDMKLQSSSMSNTLGQLVHDL